LKKFQTQPKKDMTSNVKNRVEVKESGIKPFLPKKYDFWISAAIVSGAVLLVGLVILNTEAIWK
jgi:hypothetical protein